MQKIVKLAVCFVLSLQILAIGKNNMNGGSDFNVTDDQIQQHQALMNIELKSLDELAAVWPKTVEEIQIRTCATIALAQQEIDEILQDKKRTFENTVQALDQCVEKFNEFLGVVSVLDHVHPDHAMREAATQAVQKLNDASIDLFNRVDLYQLIQKYSDDHAANQHLTSEDWLLLKEMIKEFKRSGLHLEASVLQQVKQLQKELAKMSQNFSNNIAQDNVTLTVCFNELQGVDSNFINSLKKDGDDYILDCNLPTYVQVMKYCKNEQTRKKLFLKRSNLAYENDSLLISILKKRDELAALLGFDCFADFDLDQTSAKTVPCVQKFLTNLADAASKNLKDYFEQLRKNLPNDVQLNDDETLNPWDLAYADTAYTKKHFNVDENEIAQYLPVDAVINGVFEIYQKFLGLTFKKVKPVWSWHEDVFVIEIYKTDTQQLLGYLMLDLYPRDNKYKHACVTGGRAPCKIGNDNRTAYLTMLTNFPKATADTPALLKHDDVVTFFHEFGHAMHHFLGRAKHASKSGLGVAHDFVETPSQMFEQWMFQPEMLATVGGHYQTGLPMPETLIEQKIKLHKADAGYAIVRQCMFSLFALELMTKTQNSYKPYELFKHLSNQYFGKYIRFEPDNHWYCTFGHLAASNYAAKYFAYLWTRVIAVDLFEQIKNQNYDATMSQKVLALLGASGGRKADELLFDFLGRAPNQDAFLKINGLDN